MYFYFLGYISLVVIHHSLYEVSFEDIFFAQASFGGKEVNFGKATIIEYVGRGYITFFIEVFTFAYQQSAVAYFKFKLMFVIINDVFTFL